MALTRGNKLVLVFLGLLVTSVMILISITSIAWLETTAVYSAENEEGEPVEVTEHFRFGLKHFHVCLLLFVDVKLCRNLTILSSLLFVFFCR
jgi:hypothetical protein